MRPSHAVRTVWDAEAIDTSHLGFRPIQKIATIYASSGLIRGIPTKFFTDDLLLRRLRPPRTPGPKWSGVFFIAPPSVEAPN